MKTRIIFIIIPIITGIIASATGFSLVWRLFILSLLVPVVSYLWVFFNIRGIRSEVRPLPERSHVGDILEDRLRLININRLPKLLLRVQEHTDFPGHSNVFAANIPSRGECVIQSRLDCSRRGRYSLGHYTVSTSDPFGLFPRSLDVGSPQTVTVYPNAVELPFFDPMTYINLEYGSGRWLESQISPNVASIREYVSGDSLKRIHWQTTAHSSKLMVKVFDPDRSRSQAKSVWILLDMSQSAQAGNGPESTEEYGIKIAASLLKKFIENGWPVGFSASADKPYHFPPEAGTLHQENINTALALMHPWGEVPVEKLIAGETAHFNLKTMLVVITPSWSEKLASSFIQIKNQQGLGVVILIDPNSFTGVGRSVIPRSLVLNEIQTYIVRQGDNLATALDSRNLSRHGG